MQSKNILFSVMILAALTMASSSLVGQYIGDISDLNFRQLMWSRSEYLFASTCRYSEKGIVTVSDETAWSLIQQEQEAKHSKNIAHFQAQHEQRINSRTLSVYEMSRIVLSGRQDLVWIEETKAYAFYKNGSEYCEVVDDGKAWSLIQNDLEDKYVKSIDFLLGQHKQRINSRPLCPTIPDKCTLASPSLSHSSPDVSSASPNDSKPTSFLDLAASAAQSKFHSEQRVPRGFQQFKQSTVFTSQELSDNKLNPRSNRNTRRALLAVPALAASCLAVKACRPS